MDRISTNQIRHIVSEATYDPGGAGMVAPIERIDASLQVNYQELIERAAVRPAEDAAAVEKAREMLASGELDSAEMIRGAAAKMMEFGV